MPYSEVAGRQGPFRLRARWRRVVVAAMAALALSSPLPADASEVPPGERPQDEIVTVSNRIRIPSPVPKTASRHMWVWSKGGRAYFLTEMSGAGAFTSVTAVDTQTGHVVGTQTLPRPAYAFPAGSKIEGAGQDRSMVIDEEGGRLFVATQSVISGNLGKLPTDIIGEERPCVVATTFGCLSGVSVLDAATLDPLSHIPVGRIEVDGGLAVTPELVAMEFTPALEGQGSKLLLLVRDQTPAANAVEGLRANPRLWAPSRNFLVQFDVDSGLQDWAIHLAECAGSRSSRSSVEANIVEGMPHEAALFQGRAEGDSAVYVACHSRTPSFTSTVLRVPLDESGMPQTDRVVADIPPPGVPPETPQGGDPTHGSPTAPIRGAGILDVQGPDSSYQFLADPDAGRFLIQVVDGDPKMQVWWVFDTTLMRFVGTVGIGGPIELESVLATVDRSRGRLYVFGAPNATFAGGLYAADVRTNPVSQALHYPGLAELVHPRYQPTNLNNNAPFALSAEVLADDAVRVWLPNNFVNEGSGSSVRNAWVAFEDSRLGRETEETDPFAGRTLDLEEMEGITASTWDGAARGYGFRSLLIGGVDAALRADVVDPVGAVEQCGDGHWDDTDRTAELNLVMFAEERRRGGPCYWLETDVSTPCAHGNREVMVAIVGPDGPAVIDGIGSRGVTQPFLVDSATRSDVEHSASRCAGQDWDQVWSAALFGRAPTEEPQAPLPAEQQAECVLGERGRHQVGGEVHSGYSAAVRCDEDSSAGHAYARGTSVDGVSTAEALSTYRIYRDPRRGIVARVESVVRGISIDGVIRIDTVRGVAESWANGRRQPVPSERRPEGYVANCDFERTAGTCFQRHLLGLTTPGYHCGRCGDEDAFLAALNAALRAQATVHLRHPARDLAAGAENGFIAAVQKPEADRFGDLVLNHDLMQTTLPTLEIVRYAPPNRFLSRGGERGRQVYQFAGVEVSSSYGVQCLLVYDPETETCSEAPLPSGSLTVSLADLAGKPLAGGVFEVRSDTDVDGVVGLFDELVGEGACVTAADGIGTCMFENLEPGSYLVSQTAAPPGYSAVAEPWVSEVAAGEARTVTFTNASDVSVIEVSATDAAGEPVEGATFSVYPDPDADGKVAPDAIAAATCTTDASGTCAMEVPAGSYVLVQTVAPAGLEPIEPVAFAFASGGQTAAVGVTNAPAADTTPGAPPAQASPVYSPPGAVAPPVESIGEPGPTIQPATPQVSVPERLGGTVTQVIRAPGDALRLLTRDPLQAIAWVASLVLFALAAMAVRRRQHVLGLASPTLRSLAERRAPRR